MAGRENGAAAGAPHPRRNRRSTPLAAAGAAAVLAFGSALPAAAEESLEIGGYITFATDYLCRGISQTLSRPALQAAVELEHASGFSGYLWASNVDFVAAGDPDDGARVELNAAMGYELALSARVRASLTRVEYLFPGGDRALGYDYGEWIGEMTLDDRHGITLGYSADSFGTGKAATYVALTSTLDLPAGLALEASIGGADLRKALGEAYAHGSLVLSGSIDRFVWELGYYHTDASASAIFYRSVVEPRAVLAVTLEIP